MRLLPRGVSVLFWRLEGLFSRVAGVVEAGVVARAVEGEERGGLLLKRASLEDVVGLLLLRGFSLVEYGREEEGVVREHARLVRGVVVVDLHRRWVTIPPATRVEWLRLY